MRHLKEVLNSHGSSNCALCHLQASTNRNFFGPLDLALTVAPYYFVLILILTYFQIYVHSGADLKGPYSKEEPVLRVQQWSQSEEALQLTEERGSVAGYYNYPRLPSTLEKYTDSYKEKGELKVNI